MTGQERKQAVDGYCDGYSDGVRVATDQGGDAWAFAPNLESPCVTLKYEEGDGEGCPERQGFDLGYWHGCEWLNRSTTRAHKSAIKAYPLSEVCAEV